MLNHLEYEPRTWDEFYNNKNDFNIQRARTWLKKNRLPTFLYLEGPSGTGKTVFAKTLIRTFNCENRIENTDKGCGKCAICKSDPSDLGINNNIIWVNSSFNTGSSQQSVIKEALTVAEQGPILKSSVHSNEILFIVFEEAQNISKDLLQRVLAFGDVNNHITSKLCFIFITMSPEDMNSSVNKALRQRGSICKFKRPSPQQLKNFIVSRYPDIPDESLDILVEEAEGSYRGILNLYEDCKEIDEGLDTVVISKIFNCFTYNDRLELWKDLKRGIGRSNLMKKIQGILYFMSPVKLVKQLQNDLDKQLLNELCSLENYLEASRELTEYLLYPETISPVITIASLIKNDYGF